MDEDEGIVPTSSDLQHVVDDFDLDLKLRDAAIKGNSDDVKRLLCQGARVFHDSEGSTALHYASVAGFPDVVRLLVENGCDVDTTDCEGATALSKAAAEGHLEVIEVLINDNCAVDTHDDNQGNTPLHEAAMHGWSKTVDTLLRNYSNACATNRAGNTPLHLAAQNGHNQSARVLLHGGSSPDITNNYGDTPLHTSVRYGHAGATLILISGRASISEQNKNGDTALHIASAFKRRKIAKLLIDGSINIFLKNKLDEMPMDIAKKKSHQEIVNLLAEAGSKHMRPAEPTLRDRDTRKPAPEEETPSTSAASKERKAKEKKKSSVISWIRKKLLSGGKPTRSEAVKSKGAASQKPNSGAGKPEADDNTKGVFNSYKKQIGMAYYRDLAGNVRQGPAGFVPTDEELDIDDGGFGATELRRPNQGYTTVERRRLVKTNVTGRTGGRGGGGDEGPSAPHPQLEGGADLSCWLQSQIKSDNPFAYSVGRVHRFNDDCDQTQLARYSVTENFPPPPRLFRCRSDETLTHSEYSYHGKAFRSRELAIEELRALETRALLREKRKRIRAGKPSATDATTQKLPHPQRTSALSQDGIDRAGRLNQIQASVAPPRMTSRLPTDTGGLGIHSNSTSVGREPDRVVGRRANPPHRGSTALTRSHSDIFRKEAAPGSPGLYPSVPSEVRAQLGSVGDEGPDTDHSSFPLSTQHAKSIEGLSSSLKVDHNSNSLRYRNKHVSFSSVHESNETEPESVGTGGKAGGSSGSATSSRGPTNLAPPPPPRGGSELTYQKPAADRHPQEPPWLAPEGKHQLQLLQQQKQSIQQQQQQRQHKNQQRQHHPQQHHRQFQKPPSGYPPAVNGRVITGTGSLSRHKLSTGAHDYEDMHKANALSSSPGFDGGVRPPHQLTVPEGTSEPSQQTSFGEWYRDRQTGVAVPSAYKPLNPPNYKVAVNFQRQLKTPSVAQPTDYSTSHKPMPDAAVSNPLANGDYCDMNNPSAQPTGRTLGASKTSAYSPTNYQDMSPGGPHEGSTSSNPDSGYAATKDYEAVVGNFNPHTPVKKSISDSPLSSPAPYQPYRTLPTGTTSDLPPRTPLQTSASTGYQQPVYNSRYDPNMNNRYRATDVNLNSVSKYYMEKKPQRLPSDSKDEGNDRHPAVADRRNQAQDSLLYQRQLQHYAQKINKLQGGGKPPARPSESRENYQLRNPHSIIHTMTTDV